MSTSAGITEKVRVAARLMRGDRAVVEGMLAAGIEFYAGYPITPANDIARWLSEELPQQGSIFIQMEDEISSLAAVLGASLTGLKSATATSGPGFSLMQEHIGYAAIAEIPCVIIDVQRTGPSTGRPTQPSQGDVMQSRWGTHGDHPIIVLCPSSVLESYTLAIRAFNLAERYRTPVILLMDEVIAHMREKVRLPLPEAEIYSRPKVTTPPQGYRPYSNDWGDVPPMASFGDGYRYNITGLFHDESGFYTADLAKINTWLERLFGKIDQHLDDIVQVQTEDVENASVVVVSYGAAARSARYAVKQAQENGVAAGMVKLLTLWPFPEAVIRQLAPKIKRFVVVEMNRGQIQLEVERVAGGKAEVVGVNRMDGEMVEPGEILKVIEE